MGIPGRNALNRPAAAIAGKLVFGQCAGKADPDRAVAAGNALQHIGREGQIPGILRQGKHLHQCRCFLYIAIRFSAFIPAESSALRGFGFCRNSRKL